MLILLMKCFFFFHTYIATRDVRENASLHSHIPGPINSINIFEFVVIDRLKMLSPKAKRRSQRPNVNAKQLTGKTIFIEKKQEFQLRQFDLEL